MTSLSSEVGIDVAKDHLDISIDSGKPFRISNSEEDCEALADRLPPGSIIHLEASGGYERTARNVLRTRGFTVNTHDPLKARRYAQSQARQAKTDAIDACSLSKDGKALVPQQEKSQEREALSDISRTITCLKREAAKMKVRAKVTGLDPMAKQAFLDAAALLTKKFQELEKQFVSRVMKSSLREKYLLACTVPGVGPCTARVLVCELPEQLEKFTIAQLTAYAGVAPIDNGSGKKKVTARIRRGNARLKAALYMPAICCVGRYAWASELYAKLMAKGRKPQQAAVAVMRRLLVRALAVLKRGSAWQAEPQTT